MIEALIVGVLPVIVGWMLDLWFGDPEHLPHPVVWMGKWIAFGERLLNSGDNRVMKGAVFSVCSIALAYFVTEGLIWTSTMIVYCFLPMGTAGYDVLLYSLYMVLASVIIFFCLAGHTLRKEVRMVFEAVDRSVEDGRKQVGRIVGRDTSKLSAQECRTAALETLAENLSDGVIAPLFWLAALGLPGMVAYKMVNTLDSMIGYQNARYKDFGRWAAKIDDVANYVPARFTALMIVVAYKVMAVFKIVKRMHERTGFSELMGFVSYYGPLHASPNSGWPEAALAGILNCRFGGPHYYFGEYFYKPFIGSNERKLTTSDMQLSVRIALVAESMVLAFLIIPLIACEFFFF